MSQILTGFFFDIGGREIYEDRVTVKVVETAGGVSLAVAVVADGVGGSNKGERASQLAMETVLEAIRTGRERDISDLLAAAVQAANRAVFGEFGNTGGASTTMALAAIDQASDTLTIANVGDSRIYLCRNGKLTQLSIDHTFANVMPWQGKMSAELARENPRADVLMLALGPKQTVPVDVGFYVNITDYHMAAERGKAGLQLKEGDSILVCSDGLIKNSSVTGQPFVTPEEVVRVLTTQEGEKAARSLVSFALGRNPEDNISAAVLQMPDPKRVQLAGRPMRMAGIAIGALAVLLLIALFVINRARAGTQAARAEVAEAQVTATFVSGQTVEAIGLLETRSAESAAAATATQLFIDSWTPTPTTAPTATPTPRPPAIPGQIGVYAFGNDPWTPFTINDQLPSDSRSLKLELDSSDGEFLPVMIFATADSRFGFSAVDKSSRRAAYRLSPGGDIFVRTGDYTNELSTLGAFQAIVLADPNSCLSIDYPADDSAPVTLSCFAGVCSYQLGSDAQVELPAGSRLLYNRQTANGEESRIPNAAGLAYRAMLTAASRDGAAVADACGLPRPATPTATPMPTNTPRPATATATTENAPSGPGPGGQATTAPTVATIVPSTMPPTATPKPPTDTPAPPPTDTPKPPTATPKPPTATPAPPPTDTPASTPTDTPSASEPRLTATPTP